MFFINLYTQYRSIIFVNNLTMKSISLYLSAFIPMYALLLLQMFIEIANGNRVLNILNIIIIIVLTAGIIFGSVGLSLALKEKKTPITRIKIIKTTNITDQHFFSYISIFILFTLSFDISNMAMFITTILILIIIGIVYIHNKIFYINPLLNLLGFSFYEITYITKGSSEPKTAKVFYQGHKNLNNKWVDVKLENTNFSFINTKTLTN